MSNEEMKRVCTILKALFVKGLEVDGGVYNCYLGKNVNCRRLVEVRKTDFLAHTKEM